MPIKVLTKPVAAKVAVENTHMGKVVDSHQEEVPVAEVKLEQVGPYAEVGLDVGVTIQTAPYNSTRVGVSLKLPCLLSEIDDVATFAEEWVNSKMEELTKDIEPYAGPA